jgi:hypothetical protein
MEQKSVVYHIQAIAPNPEPIVLESSAGITLRCGEATLRLLPNGELQLNGQTVKIEANQTMALKAAQVRVNCEE